MKSGRKKIQKEEERADACRCVWASAACPCYSLGADGSVRCFKRCRSAKYQMEMKTDRKTSEGARATQRMQTEGSAFEQIVTGVCGV